MFEIKRGSEIDNLITKMENALYNIRNCEMDPYAIENELYTLQTTVDVLEDALLDEINA